MNSCLNENSGGVKSISTGPGLYLTDEKVGETLLSPMFK